MRVDNIFELVKKYDKEEDQISAGFGFVLKNNPGILRRFLTEVGLDLKPKELKVVDVETQVEYGSWKSRIDLQLTIYGKFLVFVESKLHESGRVSGQLARYAKILESKRPEYDDVRLVYVSRQAVREEDIQKLRERLTLSENEFFLFSWEDMVKLTEECRTTETIKLFKEYVGDTMYAVKRIKEQKIKDIVEVLVCYTNPVFWDLVREKGIAVQGDSTPDAIYIAFLRTHRGKKRRAAITHIAKVMKTKSHVSRKETYERSPGLQKFYEEHGHLEGTHKHYLLAKRVRLAREIPSLAGERPKGQVNFQTTMSELLRVNSVGGIKTLRQLERSKKSSEIKA